MNTTEPIGGQNNLELNYKAKARFEFSPVLTFIIEKVKGGFKITAKKHTTFVEVSAVVREWVARGLYFMGVPFKEAIARTEADVNAHQELEWHLERVEANEEWRRIADDREPMSLAEQKAALLNIKNQMENEQGHSIGLSEVAKVMGLTREQVTEIMQA